MSRSLQAEVEPAFSSDFSAVRVHTDSGAAESARMLQAQAFTAGSDVYFAPGRYQPHTSEGRRLLAHELAHVAQQRSSPAPLRARSSAVSSPRDSLERQAEAAADDVVAGHSVDLRTPSTIRDFPLQRYSLGEFVEDVGSAASTVGHGVASAGEAVGGAVVTAGEAVGGAVVTAGEAVGEAVVTAGEAVGEAVVTTGEAVVSVGEAAVDWLATTAGRAAMAAAEALADALGGTVTIRGTHLIIDVPELSVCPTIPVQLTLPELGKDFPFLIGVLPITGVVSAYGLLGLHVGVVPEISAQLGPCLLSNLHIDIDPLGPSFSGMGVLSVAAAIGLGAEPRVALKGEVGVIIFWPDPPLVIRIPAASLEAGLAGFVRGLVVPTFTVPVAMSFAGGSLHASVSGAQDLGLALEMGLAGYGALKVLGMNLCTLYWPLWQWQGGITISSALNASLDVSPLGASASLSITPPHIGSLPFEDLPLAIQRNMFSDDCPLCDILRALNLMPSQNGGEWKGHPKPPWPLVPLFVYPRDPGITSKSLCRGACGPNCDTCRPPTGGPDNTVCDPFTGVLWRYPNYFECDTHIGCREHDACYDWCANHGEMSLWGPCHRVCDFESVCRFGVPNSVSWIGGGPPHDGTMVFSDEPKPVGSCVIPCPAGPGTCPPVTSVLPPTPVTPPPAPVSPVTPPSGPVIPPSRAERPAFRRGGKTSKNLTPRQADIPSGLSCSETSARGWRFPDGVAAIQGAGFETQVDPTDDDPLHFLVRPGPSHIARGLDLQKWADSRDTINEADPSTWHELTRLLRSIAE